MNTTSTTPPYLIRPKSKKFARAWEESWTYIKTVVDVVREPILILDKHLCVIAANEPFYRSFQVEKKDTEHTLVYDLGNGQWNIPALRTLLEDILPQNTFFKGFEVSHRFPHIGHRVMLLNARRIYREHTQLEMAPPIILLAIEDITSMAEIAEKISQHTHQLDMAESQKIQTLTRHIAELQQEIHRLKN